MRTILATVAAVLVTGTACAQYKADAPRTAPPASSSGPKLMQPTLSTAEPLESARRITRVEAGKMANSGKAVFIDVRPKLEFDAGHIKGAINIPLAELQMRYGNLPMKKFLITYCA